MRRILWLILFALSATGCYSLKVTDDVWSSQFAQALDGDVAVIHLQDSNTIRARSVYVETDSTRYVEWQNQLAPKSWVPDSGAVPTAAIAYIDVTRPRKPERAGGNLALGAAIGLGVGISWGIEEK